MIGAIIGDIVGSRFEFNNTNDKNFTLFTKDCDFTDDTICTVAVADAILKQRSFKDSLLDWCRRYPNPMGAYGGRFGIWLRDNRHEPYNSFGNGSAMRVSPCAAAPSDAKAIRWAYESAVCTHNHVEGVIGAVTVVKLIRELNQYDLSPMRNCEDIVRYAYGDNWRECLPMRGVFDETCQGCVPLAYDIITRSTGFEDAIRNAVAYGGDSDTLAAIVGSMAEAYWGVPDKLRVAALQYLPQEMQDVITEFETKYPLR